MKNEKDTLEEVEKDAKKIKERLIPSVSVTSRQVELMKKRYEVDEENKIVTLTFRFQKASELLMTDVGKKESPQFNPDVIDKINRQIDAFPLNYRVEIEFDILDYEGYQPKAIMEAFNDSLEMTQYASRRQRKSKWVVSTILILIGIFLLFFMAIGKENTWFGDGVNEEIISEIIDIAGWVFIWEAVSMLFLEPAEQTTFALKMRQKIVGVAFYQQNEDVPFAEEKADEIFTNWSEEGKIKRVGKACLLGSSAAFIAMAFFSLYSTYASLRAMGDKATPAVIAVTIVFALFMIGFHLVAGFGGISKYMGKENWLSKAVGPIAIIIAVVLIISIIASALTSSVQGLVTAISSSIINIFYVSGYFIDKYLN